MASSFFFSVAGESTPWSGPFARRITDLKEFALASSLFFPWREGDRSPWPGPSGDRLVPVQCSPFAGGLSGKPSASLHPSHFAALVGPSRSRGRGRPRVFRATRPAHAHSGLGCISGPFCTRADQTVTLRCIQSRFCTCNGDGSQRGWLPVATHCSASSAPAT